MINYLTCPYCFGKSRLIIKNDQFTCSRCRHRFIYRNHILKFINPEELDNKTAKELKGNTFALNEKNIKHFANKDNWSKYYNFFVNQKINYLLFFLDQINYKGVVSLGSGPGFEIKEILKRRRLSLIFSSDLALSATKVVPYTLKNYNGRLCLFTSDLRYPPFIPNANFPIIIYEALHHTGNIHKTINTLLAKGYKDIIIVEPCTNFIIKILAKLGMAQKEEYSGMIPDFLDIKKLKEIASHRKYKLQIKTMWDIPENYIRLFSKEDGILEKIFMKLIYTFSLITNYFSIGSFAIVYFKKSDFKQ
ncbi:MAG: hypothetical protein GYA62_13385 [Bacteroidales bacterium]|nr:hypothetical protein [Bacteroidales bacterium]